MASAKKMVDAVTEGVKKASIGGEKASKKKKAKAAPEGGGGGGGSLEMSPPPEFLKTRLELFDRLKKKHDAEVAKKSHDQITITMPDGSVKMGTSWETTPGDIAKGISNSLYKRSVVSRLDSKELWDLDRPLERSCKLELLSFDDDEGKQVFWHSSPISSARPANGDSAALSASARPSTTASTTRWHCPTGAAVHQNDWAPLERIVGDVVKERQKFERLEMTKEELLEMFSYK